MLQGDSSATRHACVCVAAVFIAWRVLAVVGEPWWGTWHSGAAWKVQAGGELFCNMRWQHEVAAQRHLGMLPGSVTV